MMKLPNKDLLQVMISLGSMLAIVIPIIFFLVGCSGPSYGIAVKNKGSIDASSVFLYFFDIKLRLDFGNLPRGIDKTRFQNGLPNPLSGEVEVSWVEGSKKYSRKMNLTELIGGKKLEDNIVILFVIEDNQKIVVSLAKGVIY